MLDNFFYNKLELLKIFNEFNLDDNIKMRKKKLVNKFYLVKHINKKANSLYSYQFKFNLISFTIFNTLKKYKEN